MADGKYYVSFEKYKSLLKERDTTTATVCRDTGILESTIANWKSRQNGCSIDTVKRLSDYFKVPIENFLDYSEQ